MCTTKHHLSSLVGFFKNGFKRGCEWVCACVHICTCTYICKDEGELTSKFTSGGQRLTYITICHSPSYFYDAGSLGELGAHLFGA